MEPDDTPTTEAILRDLAAANHHLSAAARQLASLDLQVRAVATAAAFAQAAEPPSGEGGGTDITPPMVPDHSDPVMRCAIPACRREGECMGDLPKKVCPVEIAIAQDAE